MEVDGKEVREERRDLCETDENRKCRKMYVTIETNHIFGNRAVAVAIIFVAVVVLSLKYMLGVDVHM